MKIKRLLKYIIPIVLVVGVVICFLVSRMQKPTGRDNVITSNVDLPQDDNGNYIAQRYESNLIPSDTGFTVNDQPVDNVIRVDDGESGNDSDYILIEIEEQDIKDLFKKEDLLDGHPTTDQTIELTKDIMYSTNIMPLDEKIAEDYNGPFLGIPSELAYDTSLVKRVYEADNIYIGMLYGRWPYYLTEAQVNEYNISTELVIASFYSGILLKEEDNMKTFLTDGCVTKMSILD